MKVRAKSEVHNHALDEFNNQNLGPNKVYEVIGITDEYFRIVDEASEPILYPKYLFDIIDPIIPQSWVRKDYPDDEYFIDPPELSGPDFDYEDYFDGKPEAKVIFERFLISHGLIGNEMAKSA
jgi:hypothetical protein